MLCELVLNRVLFIYADNHSWLIARSTVNTRLGEQKCTRIWTFDTKRYQHVWINNYHQKNIRTDSLINPLYFNCTEFFWHKNFLLGWRILNVFELNQKIIRVLHCKYCKFNCVFSKSPKLHLRTSANETTLFNV